MTSRASSPATDRRSPTPQLRSPRAPRPPTNLRVRDVGLRPGTPRICHVVREDLDLAEAIPLDRREQAIEDCTAREIALPSGPWAEPAGLAADAVGYMILECLLLRRISVEGRFAVELRGECDLLRPWQPEDSQAFHVNARWDALDPMRPALAEGSF